MKLKEIQLQNNNRYNNKEINMGNMQKLRASISLLTISKGDIRMTRLVHHWPHQQEKTEFHSGGMCPQEQFPITMKSIRVPPLRLMACSRNMFGLV